MSIQTLPKKLIINTLQRIGKLFFFLLIFLLGYPLSIEAQNALGCDGRRYLLEINKDTTQTTVQYGANTTLDNRAQNLFMDVVEPKGDAQARRPLLILATGGGFVAATRSELLPVCAAFAQRGYVCATIDYRLFNVFAFFRLPDSVDIAKVGTQAMQDMKASIRYFWQDARTTNRFKIDTNNIIIAGISAGAITALNVGMLDSADQLPIFYRNAVNEVGGFEGVSGNAGLPTKIKAVINMSGALYRKEILDANDPPLASYHGTADNVVPYGTANNVYGFLSDGSGELYKRTLSLNKTSVLFTVPNGGHETIYRNGRTGVVPQSFTDWSVVWTDFMKKTICGEPVQNFTSAQELDNQAISVYPNPSFDVLTLENTEGVASANIAAVQVFDIHGRTIFSAKNTNAPQVNLKKSDIGAGVFFAKITFGDKRYAVKKIVFE